MLQKGLALPPGVWLPLPVPAPLPMPARSGSGGGLLRLHSTYRHDLKIYSSDEGRVQVWRRGGGSGLDGGGVKPVLRRVCSPVIPHVPLPNPPLLLSLHAGICRCLCQGPAGPGGQQPDTHPGTSWEGGR